MLRSAALWSCLIVLCQPLVADDLGTLMKEYMEAKSRIGGASEERAEKVKDGVAPIALRIAAIGTDEALSFLRRELNDRVPEISGVCSSALIRSEHPRAVAAAIQGLSRRPPVAQAMTLEALAEAGQEQVESVKDETIAFARGVKNSDVKQYLPPVLSRYDNPQAAQIMLRGVRVVNSRNVKSKAENIYRKEVMTALVETKNKKVKQWLAKRAFATAGKDAARLLTVIEVVGTLKLKSARKQLVKNVARRDPAVAAAAVEALSGIGVREEEVKKIAAALKKKKGEADLVFRIRALDALSSAGTKESFKIVSQYARDRDPAMRAIAMGSLGTLGANAAAIDLLIDGLSDDALHVRVNALRALRDIRDKRVIDPLISLLGEETEYGLRVAALRALIRLTGNNMGLEISDWKKWWALAAANFSFDDAKEKAVTDVIGTYDLSYFGIEVASRRLHFIADISGSMRGLVRIDPAKYEDKKDAAPGKGEAGKAGTTAKVDPTDKTDETDKGQDTELVEMPKIEVLKKELAKVIEKLPEETRINILTFDANYRSWQKELQPIAGRGRSKALDYVKAIRPGSGTNVFDTLEHALKDSSVDTIYLLSDGRPSRGRIQDPDAIRKKIRDLNRVRAVTIHCIGIGEDATEVGGFLKQLAQENAGEYRFVGLLPESETESE